MTVTKPAALRFPNLRACYGIALTSFIGIVLVAVVAHATWRTWPVPEASLREVKGRVIDVVAFAVSSGKTTQHGWYLILDHRGGPSLSLRDGRIGGKAVQDLRGKSIVARIGNEHARQPSKIYDLKTSDGSLIDLASEQRQDRNRTILGTLLSGVLALMVGVILTKQIKTAARR